MDRRKNKKVLITGANGLLGANLARHLFQQGYDLRLLIRPSASLKAINDIPAELFYGNITNRKDVAKAVAGCQIVVHAASITTQWGISYSEYDNVNVKGTEHVAEACLDCQVEKLIYISTANTIGAGSKSTPGNELNSFNLLNLGSGYINSKYIAQQYVHEMVEKRRLPAVIINPTFMIGAYDEKPSSGRIILMGLKQKIVLCPPGGKNFVHVRDICVLIEKAIEKAAAGSIYLGAGTNYTFREFFSILHSLSGSKKIVLYVPAFVLKFVGMLGSVIQRLFRASVRLNYISAYLICYNNYYTGDKSIRELDMQYTPVEEAIRDSLSWFSEHDYVSISQPVIPSSVQEHIP